MITKNQKSFLVFLLQLIHTQIKKYRDLTKIGVGPDAGMNAYLVMREVDELTDFAQQLLTALDNQALDNNLFTEIFGQVYFYINQEYLRGHAAWLIDENNIHNPEYSRLNEQRQRLQAIAKSEEIDLNCCVAQTDIQRQCQHDSNEIAYLIVKTALALKENSSISISESKMPEHAFQIMKNHASSGGRYHQPEISKDLEDIHVQCEAYLESSELEKSTTTLSSIEAKTQSLPMHFTALITFLEQYLRHFPNPELDEKLTRLQRANLIENTPQTTSAWSTFFKPTTLATLTVASVLLIGYYIFNNNDHSEELFQLS